MLGIVSDSLLLYRLKLLTAEFALNIQISLIFWVNSDIMFPAAGDGCFYVGLGGKNRFPSPSYEPYQCCPSKPSQGSKIPKMSPAPNPKQVTAKTTPSRSPSPPSQPKPFQTARKDAKTPKSPPPKPQPVKAPLKNPKDAAKDTKEKKVEKGKGKKGFFGTGKYIWWW